MADGFDSKNENKIIPSNSGDDRKQPLTSARTNNANIVSDKTSKNPIVDINHINIAKSNYANKNNENKKLKGIEFFLKPDDLKNVRLNNKANDDKKNRVLKFRNKNKESSAMEKNNDTLLLDDNKNNNEGIKYTEFLSKDSLKKIGYSHNVINKNPKEMNANKESSTVKTNTVEAKTMEEGKKNNDSDTDSEKTVRAGYGKESHSSKSVSNNKEKEGNTVTVGDNFSFNNNPKINHNKDDEKEMNLEGKDLEKKSKKFIKALDDDQISFYSAPVPRNKNDENDKNNNIKQKSQSVRDVSLSEVLLSEKQCNNDKLGITKNNLFIDKKNNDTNSVKTAEFGSGDKHESNKELQIIKATNFTINDKSNNEKNNVEIPVKEKSEVMSNSEEVKKTKSTMESLKEKLNKLLKESKAIKQAKTQILEEYNKNKTNKKVVNKAYECIKKLTELQTANEKATTETKYLIIKAKKLQEQEDIVAKYNNALKNRKNEKATTETKYLIIKKEEQNKKIEMKKKFNELQNRKMSPAKIDAENNSHDKKNEKNMPLIKSVKEIEKMDNIMTKLSKNLRKIR